MNRTATWRHLICRLAALGTWWWLWISPADVGATGTPLHVWAGSPNPTRPFDRWATAAHTIQSAVDAAVPGDTVLVTNGIYAASDGASDIPAPASVVEVGKAIIVRSMNGPEVTIIRGVRAAAGGNGAEAVRGVYLGDGAVLSGFTITGGATREDGPTRNVGGGVLCASNLGTLTNCVLKENTASRGGGCYRGTLLRCTLSGNHAESGGGAEGAELHDCTVIDNTATWSGGGASSSTLVNCRLSANQAAEGGGTSNCKLQGCVLTFNRALGRGGGCDQSELNQCTVVGNSAAAQGGGIGQGWNHLRNCIVYFNRAPRDPNYIPGDQDISFTCTTPLPSGSGNLAGDPELASAFRLAPSSPCIASGDPTTRVGLDIDHEPWARPPALGADQPYPAAGRLTARIDVSPARVAPGFPAVLAAWIDGPSTRSVWVFDDGTTLTNRPVLTRAWLAAGTYSINLTAWNEVTGESITATGQVTVVDSVHYVDLASTHPEFPYTSWETAATNIQDAIGATRVPGATVWVNPGIYRTGTSPIQDNSLNRIVLTNQVIVRSVHGPEVTILEGSSDQVRCAYVDAGSELRGFTLTRGYAMQGGGARCEPAGRLIGCVVTGNSSAGGGGGVFGGFLEDCTISHNISHSYMPRLVYAGGGACYATLQRCRLIANGCYSVGGGAFQCQLTQCWLSGNWAGKNGGGAAESRLTTCVLTGNSASSRNVEIQPPEGRGGGASGSTLVHCTVVGNSAGHLGGGVDESTVNNSIVYYNQAPIGPNHPYAEGEWETGDGGPPIQFSCTTPVSFPPGPGNIDREPRLATTARPSTESPCLGAGEPTPLPEGDIDGEPWQTIPSMGADEPRAVPAGPGSDLHIDAQFRRTSQPGIPLRFAAAGSAPALRSVWDFGDGTLATNLAFVAHAWNDPGPHTVSLTVWSRLDAPPHSVRLPIHVGAEPSLVSAQSARPEFPYLTWETAAATIQDAIAAAPAGGGLIWVTNGIYRLGEVRDPWRGASRVALTNRVTVASVNGAAVTTIEGAPDGLRCASLEDGSTLEGFTLTRGTGGFHQRTWSAEGGGVRCDTTNGIVRQCTILANFSPSNGGGGFGGTYERCQILDNRAAGEGGGVDRGFLVNCLVAGNSVTNSEWGVSGGGATGSTLIHCTVVGNTAAQTAGGLGYGCTARGCIIYFNTAPYGPANWFSWSSNQVIENSCTVPLPAGAGNLEVDPRFVDVSAGDYRLRPDSPCIDTIVSEGDESITDLAGGPRVVDGDLDGQAHADIGAYEFLPPLLLSIRLVPATTSVRITWPAELPRLRLWHSPTLVDPVWEEVPGAQATRSLVLPATASAGFYQLRPR